MRFMVLVPANNDSEAGKLPDQELLARMGRFNKEMANAGVLLSGEGLQATSKGARLSFGAGGTVTVTDGPFRLSDGLIAGFWIIETKSKQEAIEWMKRAPFGKDVTLEVRQIFETEDFAPVDPNGKTRVNEERLRAEIASKQR